MVTRLNADFFQAGGTLSEDAPSYIERPADKRLFELLRAGEYCLVLAPRQTGKSSLIVHARTRLGANGIECATMDLQPLGGVPDPERWFTDMVWQLSRSLKQNERVQKWWDDHKSIGPITRFRTLIEDVLLGENNNTKLVVFFDEVDSVLRLPFSDEFFTLIRSLYNARSDVAALKRVTFVLLGVVSPSAFIRDARRTPFNIGTEILLDNLSRESLKAFQAPLGFRAEEVVDRIYHWTNGQPYLVQDIAREATRWPDEHRMPQVVDDYVGKAYLTRPIENNTHFNYIQNFILRAPVAAKELLSIYRRALADNPIAYDENDDAHRQLRLSGLIRIDNNRIQPQNEIYRMIFDANWVDRHSSTKKKAAAGPTLLRSSDTQAVRVDRIPAQPNLGSSSESRDQPSGRVEHGNALPPGATLSEYSILRILGHGGFGITYMAEDRQLGKKVAIKEYLPAGISMRLEDSTVVPISRGDEGDYFWGLDRFRNEAQTLVSFRHPNIVNVQRFFDANGTAYMVMDFEDGSTLANISSYSHRLTEDEVLQIALPLADALASIHEAGFLHRDIKPSNIIIRTDGTPALLDFGSARAALGARDATLTAIVTSGYAPFEQYVSDGNLGPWSDLYGLGATMYYAITGNRVPDAPERLSNDHYVPLTELRPPGFSPHVLAAIDWALASSTEDRPQTAAEFRDALTGENPEVLERAAAARTTAETAAYATRRVSSAPITAAPQWVTQRSAFSYVIAVGIGALITLVGVAAVYFLK